MRSIRKAGNLIEEFSCETWQLIVYIIITEYVYINLPVIRVVSGKTTFAHYLTEYGVQSRICTYSRRHTYNLTPYSEFEHVSYTFQPSLSRG